MYPRLKHFQPWLVPLALFVTVLLSYGIWIPWLGLYGNDLPYLWYYHLLGMWGPGLFASVDRPVSALFYAPVMVIFGEQPWLYHVFLLFLRWASGILLWWVLSLVWPDRKRAGALAALLFVVYPGFHQNPVALEFILHIGVLDLFLISLGTMLLAVLRPGKRVIWLLASALSAASIFFLEYFIGLEILRPIFLWIVTRQIGERRGQQWKKILTAWLPSLGVVSAFLIWRVFFFKTETYQPVLLEVLRVSPLNALFNLARTAIRDVWTSLSGAWKQVFQLPVGLNTMTVSLMLAAASAAVIWFTVRCSQDRPETGLPGRSSDYWGETAAFIGLLTMFAGGMVFWVTDIPVTLDFPWDRSTLSFMLGASLTVAGLAEMLLSWRYRLPVVALLIGLAVSSHFQNAIVYNQEWAKLQSFFWQLTWRIPQLQPGTLVLFDVIPLNRYSDSDMTTILNWTYAPDLHERQIPYKFFDLTIRLNSQHAGLPGLEKDLPVEHNHRGLFFSTTTSHMLAIQYDPPGCLMALGSEDGDLPGMSERLASVLPLSNQNQIEVDASQATPPAQLGSEPSHTWCYFYQKASLAQQKEDWAAVVKFGNQAIEQGYRWNTAAELMPFIEGYAMAGDPSRAKELTLQANETSGMQPALCRLWQRISMKEDALLQESASNMQFDLNCAP